MLKEFISSGLDSQYLVMGTHYTAGWFTKMGGCLGLTWVGTLQPRTTVLWRGCRQSVSDLRSTLRLNWRQRLGLRAAAVVLYAPKYGLMRLVVARNRHRNHEYLVTNKSGAYITAVVMRKRSRWSIETRSIETICRDT